MQRPGYIPSLDGLRAISILLVLFGHAGVSNKLPGGFGVTVFFFLSGYLITILLQREYAANGRISLKRFYLRRAIRLLPPLVITLAAVWCLAATGVAEGPLWLRTMATQLFFVYNYYEFYPNAVLYEGLNPLWSLSIEEHFYLVWPLLFIGMMRGRVRFAHLVLLAAMILAWRSFRFLVWGNPDWMIYSLTDTRFDSILFGCLLATAQDKWLDKKQISPFQMVAGLAASLAGLLFSFLYRDEVFRSTLRFTLQGIALMPLFYFAVTRPNAFFFLNWEPLKRIGVWSYTMYLCHYVIIRTLMKNGIAEEGSLLLAGLALLLSCAWAFLIHELVEKPLHPLRRRLSGATADS